MEERNELEELISLEEFLEQQRGEIKSIKITRDGKYLTSVLPEELKGWDIQEWLKERFGGGKYTVQMQKKDGKFGKSFTFLIEGRPKEPEEELRGSPEIVFLMQEIKELREEIRRKETGGGDFFKYLLEMEKMNRKESFEMFMKMMELQNKKGSFVEELIKGILKNPSVLMALGSGALKLIKEIMNKKDDLVELVKVAKDDPELKGVIGELLGAKFGINKGLLDSILENPELINKVLDTVNKALSLKQSQGTERALSYMKEEVRQLKGGEVSNQVSNQDEKVSNPLEVYLKLMRLAEEGKTSEEIYKELTEEEKRYLTEYLTSTGIENTDELVGVLKASGVPREYIEIVRKHEDKLDELIAILTGEEGENEGG